jgi:hypothetical protein
MLRIKSIMHGRHDQRHRHHRDRSRHHDRSRHRDAAGGAAANHRGIARWCSYPPFRLHSARPRPQRMPNTSVLRVEMLHSLVDEFIGRQPHGYDTQLGESGIRLSAAAVIEAIRTATTNRTVLVVTHDRDLAAIADRVVTLANPGPRGWPGIHRNTELQQHERR